LYQDVVDAHRGGCWTHPVWSREHPRLLRCVRRLAVSLSGAYQPVLNLLFVPACFKFTMSLYQDVVDGVLDTPGLVHVDSGGAQRVVSDLERSRLLWRVRRLPVSLSGAFNVTTGLYQDVLSLYQDVSILLRYVPSCFNFTTSLYQDVVDGVLDTPGLVHAQSGGAGRVVGGFQRPRLLRRVRRLAVSLCGAMRLYQAVLSLYQDVSSLYQDVVDGVLDTPGLAPSGPALGV